jgi:hypothetical protein
MTAALTQRLSGGTPMQIATLCRSVDIRGVQPRGEAMQWFEAAARMIIMALVVLIGAAVVRNVTDALTTATHAPSLVRSAQR